MGDTAGGYGIPMRIPLRIPIRIPMRRAPNGQVVRAISRSDFRADMRAVTVPTLIVHGDKDQVNPPENAKKVAELIPGCELKLYEGAPHGLVVTHRDRLARDILAFARG